MELVELVRGAQDAMDRGDYRLATAASSHGLAAYPSCLAAHRILGEAHLELGNAKPATDHFERTLTVDPLNVVARLGLGVASEEQKDYGAAYAHYLHAWEINPALDQVRDELVRLRGLLGVEDRLHPTRAGLAGIHARGGQLQRAANEWRAVLTVEPESRRARTSFAELLWRQGEDGLAAVACRDALRGSPENARALAILADIERRRQGPGADEFAERYRAVDPTGDVLKLLGEWRPDVDLGFLAVESALVDDFDFTAHALPADRLGSPAKTATNALAGNQIAAPDLWDTLVKDLSSELPPTGVAPTLASGVEPFSWSDAGPETGGVDPFADLGIQPFNVDDLGTSNGQPSFVFAEPPAANRGVSTADIYTAALSKEDTVEPTMSPADAQRAAEESDELAALFAPATDREIAAAMPAAVGAEVGSPRFWGGAAESPQVSAGSSGGATNGSTGVAGAFDDLAALGIEPFSFDGMGDLDLDPVEDATSAPKARAVEGPPAADPLAFSIGTISASSDVLPAPPAPPTPAVAAAPPVFVDPFVTADGTIDLTVGWDDLDRQLAAATPAGDGGRFDDLAAELGVEGIVPFDANIPGEDDDAWAPLTEADFGDSGIAASLDGLPSPAGVSADALAVAAVADEAPDAVPTVENEPAGVHAGAADADPVDVVRWSSSEHSVPEADWSAQAPPTAVSDWSHVSATVPDEWTTAPTSDDWTTAPTSDEWAAAGSSSSEADPPGLDALMALPVAEPLMGEVQVAAAEGMFEGDGTSLPVTFDDEVIFGIPLQQSSGYTELLRHVDDEELDEGAILAGDVDPFANPDANGEPLAFEDLLAVTSRDGTAPLLAHEPIEADAPLEVVASDDADASGDVDPSQSPFVFSETDLGATRPAEDQIVAVDASDLDLAGLNPFSVTGFEDVLGLESAPLGERARTAVAADVAPSAAVDASMESGLAPFDFEVALAKAEVALEVTPEPTWAGAAAAAWEPAVVPEWSGAGGLGMTVGSVVWPAFVNQTSDLIDRDRGLGSVFSRLREAKAALVAAGALVVDRRVVPPPSPATALSVEQVPPAPVATPAAAPAAAPSPAQPVMSEQTRLDLMAMRVRLIEDADAAEEIARTVEKAVGEGLSDPLALRILGEAYLKLGKMEQAAAQFRQAMLARHRAR